MSGCSTGDKQGRKGSFLEIKASYRTALSPHSEPCLSLNALLQEGKNSARTRPIPPGELKLRQEMLAGRALLFAPSRGAQPQRVPFPILIPAPGTRHHIPVHHPRRDPGHRGSVCDIPCAPSPGAAGPGRVRCRAGRDGDAHPAPRPQPRHPARLAAPAGQGEPARTSSCSRRASPGMRPAVRTLQSPLLPGMGGPAASG